MKKHSTTYPLIFGIICLIVGILAGQIPIALLLGVVPIVISLLMKWHDRKKKKRGKETYTETLNRMHQKQMRDKAETNNACCVRCGIRLSLIPWGSAKKIGEKRYCDVCYKVVLDEADKRISPPKQPASSKKTSCVCARCKKVISDSSAVWIGNHRFCQDCAKTPREVKKPVDSVKTQKTAQQSVTNVLAQIQALEEERDLLYACTACGSRCSEDKVILVDGNYYCEACYKAAYSRETDELCQIAYEIGGVGDSSLFSRVVEVGERLLAGGFEFHNAIVGGAGACDVSYTNYDDFKNNMECNSEGGPHSSNNGYICAFLSRNTLKVCVRAEEERIVLRWLDRSDKAFPVTRVFAEGIADEVYNNQCTLKQIDNMDLNDDFLSNWS